MTIVNLPLWNIINFKWSQKKKRETKKNLFYCRFFLMWCFSFVFFQLFDNSSLDLNNETVRWEHNEDHPKSICSEPCPIGHVHNHQDQCCWSCVKCREEFEYVRNDTCISCEPGWAPNDRKNGCDKLKVEVIDWLTPWAYVSNFWNKLIFRHFSREHWTNSLNVFFSIT